jgi:hypothetical protein
VAAAGDEGSALLKAMGGRFSAFLGEAAGGRLAAGASMLQGVLAGAGGGTV